MSSHSPVISFFKTLRFWHLHVAMALAIVLVFLSACKRADEAGASSRQGFPNDQEVAQALQADFIRDPGSVKARELVNMLGGPQSQLEYIVHEVIQRAGGFEVHYDVSLRMQQAGSESLRKLFASMVPVGEARKPSTNHLGPDETWLSDQIDALAGTHPAEAAAQRERLQMLKTCYQDAKSGDSVRLMTGLSALVTPERSGWYAEKMTQSSIQVHCLPL